MDTKIFILLIIGLAIAALVTRIINITLARQMKCKEIYEELKKDFLYTKANTYLLIISTSSLIIFILYSIMEYRIIALGILTMLIGVFRGIAYIDTGVGTAPNQSIESFILLRIIIFFVLLVITYVSICILLIRQINANTKIYKLLKNNIEELKTKYAKRIQNNDINNISDWNDGI